jgi:glutamate-5-semialdehyde dehydrogenase
MENIQTLLEETKSQSAWLARMSGEGRSRLLLDMAEALNQNRAHVLSENQKDQDLLPDSDPKKDRLRLNPARIDDLIQGLKDVAMLSDPSGFVFSDKVLPNGIHLKKIAVPLGVVGIIYESRPNVTMDVSALCLRSGNAVVLKGGKEAEFSNRALVKCIHVALVKNGLPESLVLLLPSDRSVVQELFTATRFLDVLIPRGSDQLIQFVRQNSLVPTIETGAGVVHTYVHSSADLDKAVAIVVNEKTTRPAVCNALDCLLADRDVAAGFLPRLAEKLLPFNVRIHADGESFRILKEAGYPLLEIATEEDYGKEWLDFVLSVCLVSNPDEALSHIAKYSSRHSEAIVASDEKVIDRFLQEVDAAAVYANASTRFTDGGEFGLGAEIGISTQKLHARGPFALEKLVTEKWIAVGNGQVR